MGNHPDQGSETCLWDMGTHPDSDLKGMTGGSFGGPKSTWATVGADVLLETRYGRGGLSDKHSKSRIAHPEIHPFLDPDLAVYISLVWETTQIGDPNHPYGTWYMVHGAWWTCRGGVTWTAYVRYSGPYRLPPPPGPCNTVCTGTYPVQVVVVIWVCQIRTLSDTYATGCTLVVSVYVPCVHPCHVHASGCASEWVSKMGVFRTYPESPIGLRTTPKKGFQNQPENTHFYPRFGTKSDPILGPI